MKKYASVGIVLIALLTLAGVACNSNSPTGPGSNPPASHTISKNGHRHLPGLCQPMANCVACHGADIRGGQNGEPSCYNCHGELWNNANCG